MVIDPGVYGEQVEEYSAETRFEYQSRAAVISINFLRGSGRGVLLDKKSYPQSVVF